MLPLFPNCADQIVGSMGSVNEPLDLIRVFKELKNSENILFDKIIFICKKLQGDILFKKQGVDENTRNRYIASMLESAGFNVKDQTQWSVSDEGKVSGEVDIFVIELNGSPKSIIEALNLDSLKKDYLIKHIDKTFKYDTTGLDENFIITYSTVVNFEKLWIKYLQVVKGHSYQYKILEFTEIRQNATDIRIGKAKHLRNGEEIFLYHILINMY